jgi:hypothetical protein
MEYKGYLIKADRTFGYFEIKHTGKGSLPKSLAGSFTHTNLAKRAIDSWVETKEDKTPKE